MTASEGVVTASSLKERLQEKLRELDSYRTLFTESSKELEIEQEKKRKAEVDTTALHRKISLMEDEYEQLATKLRNTQEKLEETLKAADECEKQRRMLDSHRIHDEEKLLMLEQIVRETSETAIDSERRYDEASRRLLTADSELERAEAKHEAADLKVRHLQEDLRSLGVKLKSMQLKMDKVGQLESNFDKTIEDLRSRLKKAEDHANNADKVISKLQKDYDELQDELLQTKIAYQSLRDNSDAFSREIRAN